VNSSFSRSRQQGAIPFFSWGRSGAFLFRQGRGPARGILLPHHEPVHGPLFLPHRPRVIEALASRPLGSHRPFYAHASAAAFFPSGPRALGPFFFFSTLSRWKGYFFFFSDPYRRLFPDYVSVFVKMSLWDRAEDRGSFISFLRRVVRREEIAAFLLRFVFVVGFLTRAGVPSSSLQQRMSFAS